MRQVASDTKSCRHALIDAVRDYEQMPEELKVRAVKNKRRTIVTTLLDAEKYPRTEVIALYLKRWHVERVLSLNN